ncbi:hypothetical protein C725_0009 [Pacificimonas flava]|uniref:Uncharacterized protein n=1 Tax=Pacificimonas flava TaxID=1234595 RepID=M2TBS5_9SPHN|nr:hypothetical protein C725_0009 [Pacificimonas flava]
MFVDTVSMSGSFFPVSAAQAALLPDSGHAAPAFHSARP